MPSPKLDDSVCVFVSDGLLNIQHRLLYTRLVQMITVCLLAVPVLSLGHWGKKALQIKYAVTSSKGVSNCDLNQKWEMIVFYNARYKQN